MALDAPTISSIAGTYQSTAPNGPYGIRYLLEQIAANLEAAELPDGIAQNPGQVASARIRIASAVQDAETVTIGTDVYEFDTHDPARLAAATAIRVNVSGGSTVQAQGTLTLDTQPTAGDTMTLGTKVYTFVPDGTANGDGEIDRGADLAAAKVNIVAAINGTDEINTPHPLVSAADFSSDDCVITALAGGTAGNSIPSTETFTAGTNVFDAETLGTTTAGVDPTAGEASDALIAAINTSGTEDITAIDISANEVLLVGSEVGANTTALSETLAGANNTIDAAMANGEAAADVIIFQTSRVPAASDVALGNLFFALDFVPDSALAQVRVTATGALKAWDGKLTITGGDHPYVQLDNSGSTDWATTDTVSLIAFA
nr:hypothetical protein [Anaerolineae bacterium]